MLHSIHPEAKGCICSSRHASEVFLHDEHRAFNVSSHGVVVAEAGVGQTTAPNFLAQRLMVAGTMPVRSTKSWSSRRLSCRRSEGPHE
eukprot:248973-Rhodomonas_salina.1